jgi:putative endonuclease
LKRHGYKVLYRNYRPPHGGGEVDLVCRHKETLVFVEVKTRRSLAFGRPSEAVDAEKQALICRGAYAWLRLLKNPAVVYRFDIVEVLAEPGRRMVCTVIENAFTLGR